MDVDKGLTPTAIVSYAHSDPQWDAEQTDERFQHALRFVHALRQHGIDADVDVFHQNVDWTRWGPRRVLECDFVLIVVSQAWGAAWLGTGDLDLNKGVRAEADALRSVEAKAGGALQTRCRLILLPGSQETDIPGGMHGLARYRLTTCDQSDLEGLLRDLTGQPKYVPPPLGAVPVLPRSMTASVANAHNSEETEASGTGSTPDQSEILSERSGSATLFESLRRSGHIAPHVVGERRARITQLLEQLEALPEPLPEDGPHLPWFRTRNKIESQLHLEIDAANNLDDLTDPEAWITTRFVWSTSPEFYADTDVEILESELEAGLATIGDGLPVPGGVYYRLEDDIGHVMKPSDPLPTFLHEDHEAQMKEWRTTITDLSQEVTAAGQSYDAVKQLRESKLADTPGAVMGPAIFTHTEKTPQGFVVVGSAVYFTPR